LECNSVLRSSVSIVDGKQRVKAISFFWCGVNEE